MASYGSNIFTLWNSMKLRTAVEIVVGHMKLQEIYITTYNLAILMLLFPS